MSPRLAFALLSVLLAAELSHAAPVVSMTGTTAGAPTFQRPVEDLSALSDIGTAVHYAALVFTPTDDGPYTFRTAGAFDTFAILYRSPFAPANGLFNALIANDDLGPGFNESGFSVGLTGGTTYSYVVTGFDNDEAGAFATTIDGPPAVAAVPEPASVLLLGLGLAAVAASGARTPRRRRVGRELRP